MVKVLREETLDKSAKNYEQLRQYKKLQVSLCSVFFKKCNVSGGDRGTRTTPLEADTHFLKGKRRPVSVPKVTFFQHKKLLPQLPLVRALFP